MTEITRSTISVDKISKQKLDDIDLKDTNNIMFKMLSPDSNLKLGKRMLPYKIADSLSTKFGLDYNIFEDILTDRKMFNPNNLMNYLNTKFKDHNIIKCAEQEISVHLDDEGRHKGPTNNAWFSNVDENRAFEQVVEWCPWFYYHKACMSDFMIDYTRTNPNRASVIESKGMNPEPEPIALMDPIEYKNKNKTCMGCIVNTDTKPGEGIHWVAIFYDARDNHNHTIEYFNSTGQPPKADIKNWMKKFADLSTEQLGITCKPITVSNISHQNSRSECGAYSAYFLMCRVIGVSYKKFREQKIPDDVVFTFRKCLFKK